MPDSYGEHNVSADAIELEENDAWLIAEIEGNEAADVGPAQVAAVEDDDHFSFEDSERFEDDSVCSLPSENGSLNHKWRGWAPRNATSFSCDLPGMSANCASTSEMAGLVKAGDDLSLSNKQGGSGCGKREPTAGVSPPRIRKLEELAARKIAQSMTFEAVEATYKAIESKKIPEYLFMLILRQCFPQSEKDIRLYSCLANTHSNQYSEGEHLYHAGAVGEIYQIGYHVSAVVNVYDEIGTPGSNIRNNYFANNRDSRLSYDVSIRIEKCRIVSCKCSCSESSSWCQHIVAVCLQRIHNVSSVQFRMTIWDSITSLGDIQVKKLAQYLINELPREYLPVAQKLIDDLQNPVSEINRSLGAPDPTADGHDDGMGGLWCMNEKVVHENIFKILANFVRPAPTVHCDIQSLSVVTQPASSEWNILIRPLRSKEPEALWNLLSIVREMLKRGDENASTLLHIITADCLRMDQLLSWWYQTMLNRSGFWNMAAQKSQTVNSHESTTQHNAASLCDEIVSLWRLVALNPKLTIFERDQLASLLQLYHRTAVGRIWKKLENNFTDNYYSLNIINEKGYRLSAENASFTERHFPGFFPALQACYMDWDGPEIRQIVTDLNFNRIQKILQTRKCSAHQGDNHNSYSTQENVSQSQDCRNIPLLRFGLQALRAEIADGEHQTTTVCNSSGSHFAASAPMAASAFEMRMANGAAGAYAALGGGGAKSSRARKLLRQRRKKAEQREQKQQLMREKAIIIRQNQQQQIGERAAADVAGAADSDDSIAEDVDEDLEDLPSSSSTQQKSSKKFKSSSSKHETYTEQLDTLFASAHSELSAFIIRFVCCEALLSHGYTIEAFILGRIVAQELLQNPPNVLLDTLLCKNNVSISDDTSSEPGPSTSKSTAGKKKVTSGEVAQKPSISRLLCRHYKRAFNCDICSSVDGAGGFVNNTRHFTSPSTARLKVSELAATTLSRTIFLVKILISGPQCGKDYFGEKSFEDALKSAVVSLPGLALELSLRILRNPRGPAATKSLEVYIYHLEHELLSLLSKIELNAPELAFTRKFAADYLRVLKRAPASRIIVPPLTMAQYILDALGAKCGLQSSNFSTKSAMTSPLASAAAYLPRGGKYGASMKYENLATSAQDDELALAVALETLGTRVFVQETDHPMLCECIRRQRGDLSMMLLLRNRDSIERLAVILDKVLDPAVHRIYSSHNSNAVFFLDQLDSRQLARSQCRNNLVFEKKQTGTKIGNIVDGGERDACSASSSDSTLSAKSRDAIHLEVDEKLQISPVNDDSSQEDEAPNDVKREDIRDDVGECRRGGRTANNSTSSTGGANDEDSISSSSMSGAHGNAESSSLNSAVIAEEFEQQPHSQATEAQAHFMAELAKRLLTEAGGNQSTTMFISLNNALLHNIGGSAHNGNGPAGGPHRYLHICAFLTGLYALGLNNLVFSTWPTRTYSAHVSWIQTQTLEMGRTALQIVRETWESHLTPTEVASLSDKAGQSADPDVVEEGALLALSVLPKAFALTAVQSQKALNQCKEHSPKLLEQACLAVEQAAEKDGVYPEVLFKVVHHWYNLHVENVANLCGEETSNSGGASSSTSSTTFSPQCNFYSKSNVGGVNVQAPPTGSNAAMPMNAHHSHQFNVPPPAPASIHSQEHGRDFTGGAYIHRQHVLGPSTSAAKVPLTAAQAQAMINQVVQQQQQQHQQRHGHQPQQINGGSYGQQLPHGFSTNIPPPTPMANGQMLLAGGILPVQNQQQHQTQQPPLGYANMHPFSTDALRGPNNMPPPTLHLYANRPTTNLVMENAGGRLHVSHSAPNLQPISGGASSATTGAQFQAQIPPPPGSNSIALMPMPALTQLPPPPMSIHNENIATWQAQQSLPPPVYVAGINPHFLAGGYQQQQLPPNGLHPVFYPSRSGPPLSHHQQMPAPIIPQMHYLNNHHHQQQFGRNSQQQQQNHAYNYSQHPQQQTHHQQQQKFPLPRFLINAHRVGMRAMDTMAQRNSDDCRSFSKYSRRPSFCDEIRWLFEEVSVKLGDAYVHSFCEKASTSIVSPFLIFDLVKDAVKYFNLPMPQTPSQMYNVYIQSNVGSGGASGGGAANVTATAYNTTGAQTSTSSVPASNAIHHAQMNAVKSYSAQAKNLLLQQAYPPSIAELMRHCVEMCYVAAYNKLNHGRFTESDIDDTCELVLTARTVFAFVPQPQGKSMFDTFLRFVRKQKACKKEPIHRINLALKPTSDS